MRQFELCQTHGLRVPRPNHIGFLMTLEYVIGMLKHSFTYQSTSLLNLPQPWLRPNYSIAGLAINGLASM
jgi:hypothetical protein